MLCYVSRTGAQNIVLIADFPADQARVAQVPDPKDEVGALLNRVDKGVGDRQLDRQLGILVIQTVQQFDDVQTAERDWRVDPYKSTNLATLTGYFLISRIEQFQHFADLLVITLARVRQFHCTGVSIKKLLTHLSLKRRDEARNGRRRHLEVTSRRRETASHGDHGEVPVRFEVHKESDHQEQLVCTKTELRLLVLSLHPCRPVCIRNEKAAVPNIGDGCQYFSGYLAFIGRVIDITLGPAAVEGFAFGFGQRPVVLQPRHQIGVADVSGAKCGEVDDAVIDQTVRTLARHAARH